MTRHRGIATLSSMKTVSGIEELAERYFSLPVLEAKLSNLLRNI